MILKASHTSAANCFMATDDTTPFWGRIWPGPGMAKGERTLNWKLSLLFGFSLFLFLDLSLPLGLSTKILRFSY
jgi:hypothetical protein